MSHRFLAVVLLGALAGCSTGADRYDRSHISPGIEERTGHGLGPGAEPGKTAIPDGVTLEDGVTEDEAVAIALWNNAAFQEALAELGFTRADLIQAGLLRNPIFSILFPWGPKQLEFTVLFPLESLWLRPKRVDVARLECERVSALLVQGGLDLVRDVRAACADLVLARERAVLAGEEVVIRKRIAEFFEACLRAGAVSELEASTARIEALRAEGESARMHHEVLIAEKRLRALLGLGEEKRALELLDEAPGFLELQKSEEELLKEAFASRPDLRAAELAMEAAAGRAGLARLEFIRLSAAIDANEKGSEGFELGPGLGGEIPIFDWNQGGRARASAGVEHAARRYVTLRHGIAREVAEARERFLQQSGELESWRSRILPSLEAARGQAERAQEKGQTSILPVLRIAEKQVEARLREAEAAAHLRRARAELERSVGIRQELERKE